MGPHERTAHMSYSDPTKPFSDPGPDHNSPKYRKEVDTDSFGTGTLIAGAVGFALIIGVIVYALSTHTDTASNPPPSTTGQSTGQGEAPVDLNPPATPRMIPTPTPPTTAPPIDNSVPPEKFAPPVPT